MKYLESTIWILAALAMVLLIYPADAGDAPHPDHGADHFYASWMMPDAPHVSCCSNEDCGPAQAKFVDGKWFARWLPEDEWTEIPPNKVERVRDMPDGRAHLCARRYGPYLTVLCFGAGAGG